MKRLLQIVALVVVALIVAVAISVYPRFSNMKAEYGTAQAIRAIETHVRENDGQWPSSPEELQNNYPRGGHVTIDYSTTSSELIADPEKLRTAVRPKSGKFYTYPHYDEMLDELLLALRETNNSEQDGAGQAPTRPESK